MKSLAELNALKEKMKDKVAMRNAGDDNIRIVVGMATCGIAAGARPVLMTFNNEVVVKKLENVTVSQTGCIGICQYEPVVEVYEPGKEKVTYIKVDSDKAKRIVEKHIIGGTIINEYTIGEINK